jgi:hypothetical protein
VLGGCGGAFSLDGVNAVVVSLGQKELLWERGRVRPALMQPSPGGPCRHVSAEALFLKYHLRRKSALHR